jgi:hypothetical protein
VRRVGLGGEGDGGGWGYDIGGRSVKNGLTVCQQRGENHVTFEGDRGGEGAWDDGL